MEDRREGLLVPPRDSLALATALTTLVFGVAAGSREFIGVGLGLSANALFLHHLQRSNP